MSFNVLKELILRWAFALALSAGGGLVSLNLYADESTPENTLPENAELSPKPTRCIALHKGQVCYQKVVLHWHYEGAGGVCLYDEEFDEPLSCWSDETRGKLRVSFQSSSDRKYVLKVDDKVVAESFIRVAWVYGRGGRKGSEKRSWRLF